MTHHNARKRSEKTLFEKEREFRLISKQVFEVLVKVFLKVFCELKEFEPLINNMERVHL